MVMTGRNIQHLATVLLKYFFDFDFAHLTHIVPLVVAIFGIAKLLFSKIGDELSDGIATVKEDAIIIKDEIAALIQRLKNDEGSPARVILNFFKEHFNRKPVWVWRLK